MREATVTSMARRSHFEGLGGVLWYFSLFSSIEQALWKLVLDTVIQHHTHHLYTHAEAYGSIELK